MFSGPSDLTFDWRLYWRRLWQGLLGHLLLLLLQQPLLSFRHNAILGWPARPPLFGYLRHQMSLMGIKHALMLQSGFCSCNCHVIDIHVHIHVHVHVHFRIHFTICLLFHISFSLGLLFLDCLHCLDGCWLLSFCFCLSLIFIAVTKVRRLRWAGHIRQLIARVLNFAVTMCRLKIETHLFSALGVSLFEGHDGFFLDIILGTRSAPLNSIDEKSEVDVFDLQSIAASQDELFAIVVHILTEEPILMKGYSFKDTHVLIVCDLQMLPGNC